MSTEIRSGNTRVYFLLSEELKKELQRLVTLSNSSLSQLMRDLCQQYIDKMEKPYDEERGEDGL